MNNPRKDPPSSSSNLPNEKNKYGWAKKYEKETASSSIADRVPSGRSGRNLASLVYSDNFQVQRGGQHDMTKYDYNQSEEVYGLNKTMLETQQLSDWPFKSNSSFPDDDLNALLKVVRLCPMPKISLSICH